MRHHLGDKYLLDGLMVTVGFINNDKAWLFPVKNIDGKDSEKLFQWCAVGSIDEKGRLSDGRKVYILSNEHCGAV